MYQTPLSRTAIPAGSSITVNRKKATVLYWTAVSLMGIAGLILILIGGVIFDRMGMNLLYVITVTIGVLILTSSHSSAHSLEQLFVRKAQSEEIKKHLYASFGYIAVKLNTADKKFSAILPLVRGIPVNGTLIETSSTKHDITYLVVTD